jgi:hypothetical protein
MSNALAVAAVTSALRYLFDQALAGSQPGAVGDARVTTLRPADVPATDGQTTGEIHKGINVFLHQVTPNHAGSITDLPTRRSDGSLAQRPVAALDLHYLITFYGDDAELDAQRLLGRAVLALAASPVLTRDLVTTALEDYAADPPTGFLANADLADQLELVKLSPDPVSAEELARLWGTFGTGFRLCLTYVATVVVLEAEVPARSALPVARRAIGVEPFSRLRIEAVEPPPGEAITIGTVLSLRGSGLRGPGVAVRLGGVELTPSVVLPEQLTVTVTEAVSPGVHAVQVVHRSPAGPGGEPARVIARSNSVAVLVLPEIEVDGVAADTVTLTVTPPLRQRQKTVVTLSRIDPAPPDEPTVLAFSVPPPAPDDPPAATIELDRDAIPDGTWLVRVTVDDAESRPRFVDDTYREPALVLP